MISVRNIKKSFKLYNKPIDRLKELIFKKNSHKKYEVLRSLSLTVKNGETLGIIGRNGAGKSTLLKLLTGVLIPDQGEIFIDGKVTGLLELGTGFNQEFTGKENIYLNGTYLGLNRAEVKERIQAIEDFSELGAYIDEPLKVYSSGMVMRLAFSVAIHADPDAFIVDEALSVGDAYFQQKCIQKIKDFKNQGGAIIFVSHDMNAVKVLCDRAILLDNGVAIEEGEPEKVINAYNYLIAKYSNKEVEYIAGKSEKGFGNQKVKITEVYLKNEKGVRSNIATSGRPLTICVEYESQIRLDSLTIGILIRDKFGQDIYGTNTHHMGYALKIDRGSKKCIEFKFKEFNVGAAKYTITVAVHTDENHLNECYHWLDGQCSFEIISPPEQSFIGLCRLTPQIYESK